MFEHPRWRNIRFKKRRDVKCTWCLTEFRVYGILEASNRGPASLYWGRSHYCPTCKGMKKCKDA